MKARMEEPEKPELPNKPDELIEKFAGGAKFDNKFLEQRRVFLWGPVTDESAERVVNRLLFLEATDPGKDIFFYINSPGGMVTSGMVMYDVMQMITSPVHTICMGLAASMGSILLAGGTKGKRVIWPHGRVMIHQPLGGIGGKTADILISVAEMRKIKEELYDIISEHTGQPLDKVSKDSDRDYWMRAQEAKDYGMIDEVLIRNNKKD